MSARLGLRRAAWRLRRGARAGFPAAAIVACAALVPLGGYADVREPGASLWRLAAAAAVLALVVVKLGRFLVAGGPPPRARRPLAGTAAAPGAPTADADVADTVVTAVDGRADAPARAHARADARAELQVELELGAALLVGAYALVQATGAVESPLYPLVYALVAFLVAFHRLAVGLPLVALALLLEAGLFRAAHLLSAAPGLYAAHAAFIGFFALLHALFVQAEVLRQRRAHRAALAAEVGRLREEARDFRLISAQLGAESRTRPRAEEEEKLAQGAVETIHQALFFHLEILKRSLGLQTCVLLWLDEAGERLRIKEVVTDVDCLREEWFALDAGAIAQVTKSRGPLHLTDPKPEHLPYYGAPAAVAELIAVPVLEDGHLRGVLCADRAPRGPGDRRNRRFDARDEALLDSAARQVLRVVQSERVFAAVERAKYEHERLYHASALLNRALTPAQVFTTAFEAAREICAFDFAAVTLLTSAGERDTRRHVVAAVSGDAAGDIAGATFGDNAGLVAMAVKNRHPLPAGGELRDKEMPVFTKKLKLRGMESLLVLPLIAADEAIGAFVLAAARPRSFGKDKREMLGVIANQVAVSAKNADMYRAMEEMATTDGLTGLVNHRTFQERVSDLVDRAGRQSRKLSLLLTDIDHFKKVNDTYGHPIGDVVLKRVAVVCREQVRKIDVAARYGGEEFAIVLDGTDLAGARLLAERIRAEVEKQSFTSDKGPFTCTLSLGIATFPDDARDVKALIHHADQALYQAKHGGRNRAVAWPDVNAPAKLRAVAR